MPSFCAYSDCVCYYWWSHVNALILCIFRLCVLLNWWSVTCKCHHFVHIQIVCVNYWWSHVNALILCIFRLCALLLIVACKCPHLCIFRLCVLLLMVTCKCHFVILCVLLLMVTYSDCVCYYWWSHVNALILWHIQIVYVLCIFRFRLCVLLLMVTCKCPHFVHIQIVCVIADGHM